MNNRSALIALNSLPRIGPVRVRRLLEAFGSAADIFRASASDIRRVSGFGEELTGILKDWQKLVDPDKEEARAAEIGAAIITQDDPLYPSNLREIYDPPLLLYVLGKLEASDRIAIGVVGSRRATHYGLQCAKKLSYQLASAGVTVLSGLARGIDTAAHEGAIAAKGRTVAVIGSGLAKLYPPENQALADKIADGHGAVVSEFPIDTAPDKQTFPMRNRIVSGWSSGILVVEAPQWSGSLITANLAAEQGRSVYAVPGPIDKPTSAGPNKLIQTGARLVMDVSDILDDLGMLFPPDRENPAAPAGPAPVLTEEEQSVLSAIGDEETHIDEIVSRCQLPTGLVSSMLMRLEMKRAAKQLPGKYYVKS